MKKVLTLFLFLFCIFTFLGCEDDVTYELEVNIIEKIFVEETSNYVVTLLPDKKVIDDYDYKADNDNISVEKGKITGIKAGQSKITFSKEIDGKNIEITVVILK